MPGVKSIVWNDANDALLLRALCYSKNIILSAEAAQLVAKIMGGTVTNKAVRWRITSLKRQLKNNDGAAGIAKKPTPKRSATAGISNIPPPKKTRTVKVKWEEEDEEDFASSEEKVVDIPSSGDASGDVVHTPGSTQRRSTLRTCPKLNYAAMDDPYATAIPDETQDNVK